MWLIQINKKNMEKIKRDELYRVLNVLTEISGNVKNLVCVIEKLEDQGTEAEAATYISMVRHYMVHIQKDLHDCVTEVDRCYLRVKKESLRKMADMDFE